MENKINLDKIKELLEKDPKLFFETDLELAIVNKFLELLTAVENGEIETGEYFNTKLKLVNNLVEEIIDTGMLFDFEEEIYGYTELDLILKEDSNSDLIIKGEGGTVEFEDMGVTFELEGIDSEDCTNIPKDEAEAALLFDKIFNVDPFDSDAFYSTDTNDSYQEYEVDSALADNSFKEHKQLVSNFATIVLESVIDFYNNEIDYKEAVDKLEQLGYSFDKLANKKVDSIELVELVTMFNLEYDKLLE